jgi:hypothetical protein
MRRNLCRKRICRKIPRSFCPKNNAGRRMRG